MTRPLFIVFEGIDGAGTTTQSQRLAKRLQQAGPEPVLTREPGGTPLAERIRNLVLDTDAGDVDHVTELLLYAASRRQHVTELINPSLASGKPVISDRYAASTVAYQGVGRGLGIGMTQTVNNIAVGATLPDITICLDLSVEIASTRRLARGGKEDRLEQAGPSLQQRVRDAFLAMATDDDRWLLVDASADELSVHETIWSALQIRFPAFPFTKTR